jgi:fermentation-respiration switch protein FrsA (DUF1100 family)
LGAAVAGELAGARPAAGLIVESSFPSVKVLARSLYYGFPADWFLRAKFALADRLKTVHLPLLVIHGSRDELVPLAMGRQVFEAAHPPKDFYVIDGAGHNDTYVVGGRAYFQRLRDFAREVMR